MSLWLDLAEFKPIRDFIVVLVTCKNKNESVNSDIIMLPYSSLHLVTSFSFNIEYQTFQNVIDYLKKN